MKLLFTILFIGALTAAEGRLGRPTAPKGLVAETSGGARYGKSGCPCVGIDGLSGQVMVHIGNSSLQSYPADVGSFCAAWDDGREPARCQDGQVPGKGNGWCAQSWCYVDPCNCDGKVLEGPPATSQFMQSATQKGQPLYYSYATCGSEDLWTAVDKESTNACANAQTKGACEDEMGCTWKKNHWGEVCVGWEVDGLCGLSEHEELFGKNDCQCINFQGLDGTFQAKIGNNATVAFPADTGSTCAAWDMDRNPDCVGQEKAEGCDAKWCYVDAAKCKSKFTKSAYAPQAKYQGQALHYSYETCGAAAPAEPPQGTASLFKKMKQGSAPEEEKKTKKAKGKGPGFNAKAYGKERGEEWDVGHVPTFKELHPNVPDSLYDRQSDGKPSEVESE